MNEEGIKTESDIWFYKREVDKYIALLLNMALKEPTIFAFAPEYGAAPIVSVKIDEDKARAFASKIGLDYDWFSNNYHKFIHENWEKNYQ